MTDTQIITKIAERKDCENIPITVIVLVAQATLEEYRAVLKAERNQQAQAAGFTKVD